MVPKKYRDRATIGMYFALLLGIGSFFVSFAYEGWAGEGAAPMLTPLGIAGVVLIAVAMVFFVWNLRREELSHERWSEVKESRSGILDALEELLGEYRDCTNRLAKTDELYAIDAYGFRGESALELYSSRMWMHNSCYAGLKLKDGRLSELKSDIEMKISKLGSKKLRKLVHNLYEREQIAHSFSIFSAIYKDKYKPHPSIERRIDQSGSIPKFEQAFARVYEWIDVMRRGADLG